MSGPIKIVTEKVPVQQTFTISELLNMKEGFLIRVDGNECSILIPRAWNGSSQNGHAFWEGNSFKDMSINTWTEGRLDKILGRLINNSGLYYFETLAEFCEEALKQGWKF